METIFFLVLLPLLGFMIGTLTGREAGMADAHRDEDEDQ